MGIRSVRFAWLLSLVAMVLFAPGCDEENNPLAGSTRPPFASTLVLRDARGAETDRFPAGEPVTLVLTVTNLTPEPQQVVFPDSQTHEFEIHDPTGALAWNWAHGQNFLDVITRVEFKPGESKSFTGTWDQIDRGGNPVAAGDYDADGYLPADRAGVGAPTVGLTIL